MNVQAPAKTSVKTSDILLRAQLAKTLVYGTFEKILADLSTVPLTDIMQCPSEYLSAVANLVTIDTNCMLQKDDSFDAAANTKRGQLMAYLRERKNLTDSYLDDQGPDGKYMKDFAKLIVNVQKLWLALVKEQPRDRLFTLAKQYPELVLPLSYGMKYYFNPEDVRINPTDITIIRAAMQSPIEASRARASITSPEHKTLQ